MWIHQRQYASAIQCLHHGRYQRSSAPYSKASRGKDALNWHWILVGLQYSCQGKSRFWRGSKEINQHFYMTVSRRRKGKDALACCCLYCQSLWFTEVCVHERDQEIAMLFLMSHTINLILLFFHLQFRKSAGSRLFHSQCLFPSYGQQP